MNFRASSSRAAAKKPITGLNSSALNTPSACPQSTPEVAEPSGAMSWLAKPTPITEPISAWEEEFGRPNAQVPRFQMIAAMSSAKIIA